MATWYNMIISFRNLVLNGGTHYTESSLTGTVIARHYHVSGDPVWTRSYITVKLLNDSLQTVKVANILTDQWELDPDDEQEETVNWSIDTGDIPPGQYQIRIEKYGDDSILITGPAFPIIREPSNLCYVTSSAYYEDDGDNADYWDPNAPGAFYCSVDHIIPYIIYPYPAGMDRTDLRIRFNVSQYATVDGGTLDGLNWYIQRDFSTTTEVVVRAEDGVTTRTYDIFGVEITPAYLFIYDNEYTKAIPTERERGDTVTWSCLISNSSATASPLNDELVIKLENETQTYVYDVDSKTLPSLSQYEDYLVEDSFTIPNDIPLGSDITYYLVFYLNASVVKRQLVISNWDVGSKGIVYNKLDAAFVRETSMTSKHFTNINNDFYVLSLDDDPNQFWRSVDNLSEGNITMFGSGFNPSVTFYVNTGDYEKLFDDMILHIGSVGVKTIEYWTEDQYAIHDWPANPDSDILLKPWIDPEFREDKYYFPIHNEELADYNFIVDGNHVLTPFVYVVNQIPSTLRNTGYLYEADGTSIAYIGYDTGTNMFTLAEDHTFTDQDALYGIPGDNANTRELAGTWMKVKITFRSLFNFFLKTAVTDFTESKI